MKTRHYLTPADHGREFAEDELEGCDAKGGFKYELVEGRLDVSPEADYPHFSILRWLYRLLDRYADGHPEVLNCVSFGSRVFVPGGRATTLEPDLAAYRGFPTHLPPEEVNWRDVSPILVVEVLSPDTAAKDLDRNRGLYLRVPSIRQYWILDTREGFARPSLIVLRRHGRRWVERVVPHGGTYTTPLLPGLSVVVAPFGA